MKKLNEYILEKLVINNDLNKPQLLKSEKLLYIMFFTYFNTYENDILIDLINNVKIERANDKNYDYDIYGDYVVENEEMKLNTKINKNHTLLYAINHYNTFTTIVILVNPDMDNNAKKFINSLNYNKRSIKDVFISLNMIQEMNELEDEFSVDISTLYSMKNNKPDDLNKIKKQIWD